MSTGPPDRKTTTLERQNPTHPLPPLNLDVIWAFYTDENAVDVRWSDPTELSNNNGFDIQGVNVYRSTDSEFGPYEKLNDSPVQSTFYRDATQNELVQGEDVSDRFLSRGDDDNAGKYIFRVKNYPMVKPNSEATPANHPSDVTVKIDGEEVIPLRVYGETGEVQLNTAPQANAATNKVEEATLPDPDSVVEVTYRYNLNLVRNELDQRIFYRVTTVGTRDSWDGELRETPLEWTEPKTVNHMENMDYIWQEAVRRNAWILDQAGERVKVFVRKYMGERCPNYDDDYKQSENDCEICYGTGIVGGYEGPYDIKVAPQDADKRLEYTERGLSLNQEYEVWTGPSPMLSQRDFLVKQNNDRFSIGSVRMPTNRGNVLQQHFSLDLIDENDIRYDVKIDTSNLDYPETRYIDWDDDPEETTTPQVTEQDNVPDSIEQRGRTPTYENINNTS